VLSSLGGYLTCLARNEKQKLQQRRERRGTKDYSYTGSDPRQEAEDT
jgi:hypothetical protein